MAEFIYTSYPMVTITFLENIKNNDEYKKVEATSSYLLRSAKENNALKILFDVRKCKDPSLKEILHLCSFKMPTFLI